MTIKMTHRIKQTIIGLGFLLIGTAFILNNAIPKERLISDLEARKSDLPSVNMEDLFKNIKYKEYKLENGRLCYFFQQERNWLTEPLQTSAALIYYPTKNQEYKLDTVFSCYPSSKYVDSLRNKNYLMFENSVTYDNNILSVLEIVLSNNLGSNRILHLDNFDKTPKISQALSYKNKFDRLKLLYGMTIINESKIVKHNWKGTKLISSDLVRRKGIYKESKEGANIIYSDSIFTIIY